MLTNRANGDQLLTIKEAAKMYPIGINKMYKLANEDKKGDFVVHIGMRKLMIKRDAFEAFLFNSFSI